MPGQPIAPGSAPRAAAGPASWRGIAAAPAAMAAGLALALLLALIAPSRVAVAVAEQVAGLAPIMLGGVHGVEENYGHMMRWTTGHARLHWPGQFGVEPAAIVVSLAGFPGRQPDQFELRVNGHATRHAVPEQYGEVRVDLPRSIRTPLDIAITTLTTRPPGDGRALGVRLESLRVENGALGERLRTVAGASGIAVVLLGALAWLAGTWVVGPGTSLARRIAGGALAWLVTALLARVLAPAALRAEPWLTVPPVLLGVCTAWLLARARHDRLVAALAGLVLALQAIVVSTWCSSAFVDAPRWDIWEMVPMLARQEAEGLTLADIWAAHNEHRPVVARVAVLANVAVSGWNHWNELWLMLGVIAAHVLLLVGGLRHLGQPRRVPTLIAVTAVGTFVATPTQWENLLQGWQVTLVVGALGISGAFVLLATGDTTWRRMFGAASLVFLGTAGFGSCLLGWPLGAATIAARRGPRWLPRLAAWVVIGSAVCAAYLHGLAPNPGHPPPAPIFRSLTAIAQVTYGTCLALAMPVWYFPEVFAVQPRAADVWLLPGVGAVGAGLAASLILLHLWRPDQRRAQTWLLPALLVVFAAAACGVTAVGRVAFGMHALTASRYIAFTGLFWVGLVLLLTVASPFRAAGPRVAATALAALIVAAGLRAWVDSRPYFEAHFVGGSLAREALLRGDVVGATALFPVAPVLDERQQYLRKRQLSLFRPGSRQGDR